MDCLLTNSTVLLLNSGEQIKQETTMGLEDANNKENSNPGGSVVVGCGSLAAIMEEEKDKGKDLELPTGTHGNASESFIVVDQQKVLNAVANSAEDGAVGSTSRAEQAQGKVNGEVGKRVLDEAANGNRTENANEGMNSEAAAGTVDGNSKAGAIADGAETTGTKIERGLDPSSGKMWRYITLQPGEVMAFLHGCSFTRTEEKEDPLMVPVKFRLGPEEDDDDYDELQGAQGLRRWSDKYHHYYSDEEEFDSDEDDEEDEPKRPQLYQLGDSSFTPMDTIDEVDEEEEEGKAEGGKGEEADDSAFF